jgi:copper oxidase (laccase) domain-containing protein
MATSEQPRAHRQLAAILSADAVGYSRRMAADEAATVAAMRALGAGRITAVLGPYACGNCYEVPAEMRAEVAERVPASYSETSWGTPAIDVAAGVEAQLAELDCTVIRATTCTIESENLYSYRREGAVSGRLAGLIRLAA